MKHFRGSFFLIFSLLVFCHMTEYCRGLYSDATGGSSGILFHFWMFLTFTAAYVVVPLFFFVFGLLASVYCAASKRTMESNVESRANQFRSVLSTGTTIYTLFACSVLILLFVTKYFAFYPDSSLYPLVRLTIYHLPVLLVLFNGIVCMRTAILRKETEWTFAAASIFFALSAWASIIAFQYGLEACSGMA